MDITHDSIAVEAQSPYEQYLIHLEEVLELCEPQRLVADALKLGLYQTTELLYEAMEKAESMKKKCVVSTWKLSDTNMRAWDDDQLRLEELMLINGVQHEFVGKYECKRSLLAIAASGQRAEARALTASRFARSSGDLAESPFGTLNSQSLQPSHPPVSPTDNSADLDLP